MSKAYTKAFWAGVIAPLLVGVLSTSASYLYVYTTTGQYCSPDASINSALDCSLQVNNRGFPLAYDIEPNYQPQHGIQDLQLIGDVGIWSALSAGVILTVRKTKS